MTGSAWAAGVPVFGGCWACSATWSCCRHSRARLTSSLRGPQADTSQPLYPRCGDLDQFANREHRRAGPPLRTVRGQTGRPRPAGCLPPPAPPTVPSPQPRWPVPHRSCGGWSLGVSRPGRGTPQTRPATSRLASHAGWRDHDAAPPRRTSPGGRAAADRSRPRRAAASARLASSSLASTIPSPHDGSSAAGHLMQRHRDRVPFGGRVVLRSPFGAQKRVKVRRGACLGRAGGGVGQGEIEENQTAALLGQLADGQVVGLDVAVPDALRSPGTPPPGRAGRRAPPDPRWGTGPRRGGTGRRSAPPPGRGSRTVRSPIVTRARRSAARCASRGSGEAGPPRAPAGSGRRR